MATKQRGFSMVEMLIYLALLASVTVFLLNGISAITKSYADIRLAKAVTASASDALQRIVYEVRQASSFDLAGSTFSSHPGVLSLVSTSADGATTTVAFSVNSGILRVSRGGVDEGPLTLSGASVTNFTLALLQNGVSNGVRITLTLQSAFGTKTRTETFYTTAVTRNM
jgi:prepilin-type N-terminal cleavage/methylation domain-containing protein